MSGFEAFIDYVRDENMEATSSSTELFYTPPQEWGFTVLNIPKPLINTVSSLHHS
jgi:hypothetical protein